VVRRWFPRAGPDRVERYVAICKEKVVPKKVAA
jgi:hypothetical protein